MWDALQIRCPGCDRTVKLDTGFAGGVCRCSHCGAGMQVPAQAWTSPSPVRPEAPIPSKPPRPEDFSRPRKIDKRRDALGPIRTAEVVPAKPNPNPKPSPKNKPQPVIASPAFIAPQRSRDQTKNDQLPVYLAIGGILGVTLTIVVVVLLFTLGGEPNDTDAADSGPTPNPIAPYTASPSDATPVPSPATPRVVAPAPQIAPAPPTPSGPPPIPAEYQLATAWEFDGNAKDSAPYGHHADHGTPTNGARIRGGVIELDGIDDLVNVPVSVDNNAISDRLIVEARFRAADPSGDERQVIFEAGGASRGYNLFVSDGRVYAGGWNIPDNESGWKGDWIIGEIDPGKWYVIRWTLDAGPTVRPQAMHATLNGVSLGSGRASQIWPNNGWVSIGSVRQNTVFPTGPSTRPSHFKGDIDYIRIYRGPTR